MSTFATAPICPEHAELSRCGSLAERSPGDPKHKVVHVRAGRLELEGPRGVWAILPTHMVFIPAGRPYEIRTEAETELAVVHLDAPMTPWHHDGCWAAGTSPLAREMVDYALRWPRAHSSKSSRASRNCVVGTHSSSSFSLRASFSSGNPRATSTSASQATSLSSDA